MADTPYVVDLQMISDNVGQTLANLTAVRADIAAHPKPSYSVHGHTYHWAEFYKFLSDEIERCMRQLNQLQPYEFVGMAR